MTEPSSKRKASSIVSGYFNPLHLGHLALMETARGLTGHLIVIVNNDLQQMSKKGRTITPEDQRLALVKALRVVDEAMVSIDGDDSVTRTLTSIRAQHPDWDLFFCNGGDRVDPDAIPGNEAEVCRSLGIHMRFGVGGTEKIDSSSRLLAAIAENDLMSPS